MLQMASFPHCWVIARQLDRIIISDVPRNIKGSKMH